MDHLSMEAGVVAFFWGSLLTNFLWTNRKTLSSSTRKYASGAFAFALGKSKKIFKSTKSQQPCSLDPAEIQSSNEEKQDNKVGEAEEWQERQLRREKTRPSKNRLRKYARNYEEWLVRRAEIRKLEANLTTNQFQQKMKQLEDSHLDDLTLKKRKSNLDKIEDFEKFVEEQLEYDGEDPRNNVLPYDPFSSEEEHSND